MSEFDSIMSEADSELFDVFGGMHMLEDPQGNQTPVKMDLNTDFQQVIDGMVQYLGPVISVLNPPNQQLLGWKAHLPLNTYVFRERIDADHSVARYSVTKL